jgi:hypothetical protein
MVTIWYPPYKINEVTDKFKVTKMPDSIKEWKIVGTGDGPKGMKVYHSIIIEKGKVDEGMEYVMSTIIPFLNIEGYTYKIEPVMGVREVYKLIGKSI